VSVTTDDIRAAVRRLGLSGRALCVHSSLRSFGHVEGGARAVVDGLLAEGCTVLVPTFSYDFSVRPLPHQRPLRNGTSYDFPPDEPEGTDRIYTTDSHEISREDMGAIPAAIVAMPGRVRGNHPLCSFSAVGPLAAELISGQAPLHVYAPFEALAEHGGSVLLMGVGPRRMTLLHFAEQLAGRNLFRRWANGPDGQPMEVECGGHAGGFPKLAPALAHLLRQDRVGASEWLVYPVRETLEVAADVIHRDPTITHCGMPDCERCNDAVLGGPILEPAGR
jgi:aminoglycoside 3-N-acetyltransferase